MCGRFVLTASPHELTEQFDCPVPEGWLPRYNIAPTNRILALRSPKTGEPELSWLTWGFLASWVKTPHSSSPLINARVETVATKPFFKRAFLHRRCLIPASGFYEWKVEGRQKQPYYLYPESSRLLAFAGLWEAWESPEGETLETCALLTQEAPESLEALHHRVPIILDKSLWSTWLNPTITDATELQALLATQSPPKLNAFPVSHWVNSPQHDDETCLKPLPERPAPN